MNCIDSVLAQLGDISGKKVDRALVLESLFLMRSVFEARAKMYGQPQEFLHDIFLAMDVLIDGNDKKLDSKRTFFVVMLSLKLLRFANNPYGENGEECMLDLANYAVLCLTELRKEKDAKDEPSDTKCSKLECDGDARSCMNCTK